jgi:hypothetical protein
MLKSRFGNVGCSRRPVKPLERYVKTAPPQTLTQHQNYKKRRAVAAALSEHPRTPELPFCRTTLGIRATEEESIDQLIDRVIDRLLD